MPDNQVLYVNLDKDEHSQKAALLRLYLFIPGKYAFRSANALSLANYFHESAITNPGGLSMTEARNIAADLIGKYPDWERDFEAAWMFLCNAYPRPK